MSGKASRTTRPAKRRAVFLDRDGVLIQDVHLLTSRNQVVPCPGADEAIARLKGSGLAVIVVTNQPVVARGMASEAEVEEINEYIEGALSLGEGRAIDRFYYCPHHPNADVPRYRVECECRKPRPGLLIEAAKDMDLDLGASYMVGDRASDIIAGRRAGCHTILVETGMHSAPPIETPDARCESVAPDFVCADLVDAAELILGNSK